MTEAELLRFLTELIRQGMAAPLGWERARALALPRDRLPAEMSTFAGPGVTTITVVLPDGQRQLFKLKVEELTP